MEKLASTLALLSQQGHEFLNQQVKVIKAEHPGCKRMARAVLIRGAIDGLQRAGFSFADCTDEFAVSWNWALLKNSEKWPIGGHLSILSFQGFPAQAISTSTDALGPTAVQPFLSGTRTFGDSGLADVAQICTTH